MNNGYGGPLATKSLFIAVLALVSAVVVIAATQLDDTTSPRLELRPLTKRVIFEFTIPSRGDEVFRQHFVAFAKSQNLEPAGYPVQAGDMPWFIFADSGLVIAVTTVLDKFDPSNGRSATATIACDDACVDRVDWSVIAESLGEFLNRESQGPIIRRDSDSEEDGPTLVPAPPPNKSSYKPLHFQPSSNELCIRNDVPEPYGLTTACAKISDDQMRLEWLTINFGHVSIRVPDSILVKVDQPRLARFSFMAVYDMPDQGSSYLECRIEFGASSEGTKERGMSPLHLPHLLIITVRDAGNRVEYSLQDTNSK